MVFCLFLGPEFFHDFDGFTGLRPPVVKVAAHQFGLFSEPAGADAELETATAITVKGGNLFGQQQRVALGDQGDAGAQLYLGGDGRRPGQGDIWVGEMGVGPGNLSTGGREGTVAVDWHCGVLGVPDGLETQVFSLLGHESRVDGIGR